MLRTTALLLALSVSAAAPPANKAKDENLEGTWSVTSYIERGQKLDDGAARSMLLTLKDGKYTLTVAGRVEDEGTYTVDTSQNPKHLDTVAGSGDKKGVLDRGIYELNGNTLKTSFDDVSRQKRPTSFDGQKFQVVEFTRVKK